MGIVDYNLKEKEPLRRGSTHTSMVWQECQMRSLG